MAKLYNLARMTTATTGTGTMTLGSAVTGWLTFATAGVSDGETVTYSIEDGNNRELGRGVYTASGTTLSRVTVLNSTNGGAKISLSGAAQVFITAAKEDIANLGEGNTFTGGTQTFQSTDAGALDGPNLILDRNSASPADSDYLGGIVFKGRNSSAALTEYAEFYGIIVDEAAGAEDGGLEFYTIKAGAGTFGFGLYQGILMGGATGGDKGTGTVNATALYEQGTALSAIYVPLATTLVSTYTPSLTGVTNVAASGALSTNYFRLLDAVHVFGRFTLDPTSAGVATELGISLPIASGFTTQQQLSGFGGKLTGGYLGIISADTTNDRASFQCIPNDATNHSVMFAFTYRIV